MSLITRGYGSKLVITRGYGPPSIIFILKREIYKVASKIARIVNFKSRLW